MAKKKNKKVEMVEKEVNTTVVQTSINQNLDDNATNPANDAPELELNTLSTFANKKLKMKPKRKRVSQAKAQRYEVDVESGLSQEAVDKRYVDGLVNIVTEKYSKSIFSIIAGNTFTFFNFLCVLVVIAYAVVGAPPASFFFVVVFAINLIMGIIQEIRAKISIEKLSLLQAPTTIVVRDGIEFEIPSNEVVLDDIFKMTTGNQIPVDGIVKKGSLEVNESLLTGESVAIKKNVGDTIMAGSYVVGGTAYVQADKVGELCYVQTLSAKAKKFKKPNSELMGTLNWIVKIVGLLIVPIALGMGLVNYNTTTAPDFLLSEEYKTLAEFVVRRTGPVIQGMIPAGLILLTTMALSLGVIRLHKRNTLVQDMYSLEMLARVDVLCLDKTGTITDGRMKVMKDIMLTDRHPHSLSDIIGVMENLLDDNNQTAIALRAQYVPTKEFSALKMLPFSSARKFSAITFANAGTYALGAPEFIVSEMPEAVKTQINQYTYGGNRVLMLAHSPSSITQKDTLPATMRPIALIVLSENIREEAIETIKWFKENQVQVKVISGDNPITVSEIAKRAGIENAHNWISLEGLSDKEVASIADKYTVFGRVTPDQKAVLLKAMKSVGHTVAMTGDGVNDILAMREADCSVTVASGADAAKNVAHIVLADNNFNSMPKVVAEGRRVINNIQQSSSLFLMKTIFITLLAIISIATVQTFPFESQMLMILELVIIGFASFFLSLQPNEKRVEGDFLVTIFSNAIPGALVLLLNVYIVNVLNYFGVFNGIENKELFIITLQVVAFTLGGAVYLDRICRPYTVWRGFVMTVAVLAIGIWFIFLLDTTPFLGTNFFGLYKIWPITKDNWEYLLLLIAIVQLNIPLVNGLFNLNKKVFTGIKNKK